MTSTRTRNRAAAAAVVFSLLLLAAACADNAEGPPQWKGRRQAVERYDPVQDRWSREMKLPRGMTELRGVVVDRGLYISGGTLGGYEFQRYDLDSRTWEALPRLPEYRSEHASTAIGTDVYVLGGRSSTRYQTVDAYDTISGIWTSGIPLPGPRAHLDAVGLGGRLYIVAGDTRVVPATSCTLDSYDPATGAWQALADVPSYAADPGAATDGVSIYAVGFYSPSWVQDEMWIYSPVTDTWSPGPDLPDDTGGHAQAALVDGNLHVYGNVHPNRGVMLSFDTTTGLWEYVKPMGVPRRGAGLAEGPTSVFVLGGW